MIIFAKLRKILEILLVLIGSSAGAVQISANPYVVWAGEYSGGFYQGTVDGFMGVVNDANNSAFAQCLPYIESHNTSCVKVVISDPQPRFELPNLVWHNGVPSQINFRGVATVQDREGVRTRIIPGAALLTPYWGCPSGLNPMQSAINGVAANQVIYCVDLNAVTPVYATPPPICLKSGEAGAHTEHPIMPATGQKFLIETDYFDRGTHPLHITRRYLGGPSPRLFINILDKALPPQIASQWGWHLGVGAGSYAQLESAWETISSYTTGNEIPPTIREGLQNPFPASCAR